MKHTIRNMLFGALLAVGLGVPYLQAADVAISALPAGSAIGGTEAIPAVQAAATVKTTPAAIDTYISASTKTLTNKTVDGDVNTVQDLPLTAIKTVLGDASKFLARDASGIPVSVNAVPTGTVVGHTDTQTLTNKTIDGASNTLTVVAGSQLSGQVPLANGGTGANLTDPNADRIAFWDDSAGEVAWLTAGTGLTITTTTITAAGGSPAGSSGQMQYNDASSFGAANLWRESADIIAQRNSTTAQTAYVYDTYTDGSNYGRIGLVAGGAGDWVQIAAQTAGTGADNYGIALTPSGTGAISAQVPDSTAVGGNARGARSVDWSTARNFAAEVASGQYSTIAGGSFNKATGSSSTVGGGQTNTATANAATVAGGTRSDATASSATVSGGDLNLASGSYSWIPGGQQAVTRGLVGAGAYSSGQRAARGDAQVILQPVRRTTIDATPVSLATDGTPAATTVMVLPSDSTATCRAIVTANVTAAGVVSMAGYEATAIVKNDSSTMTISGGTCTAIGTAEAALTTASCALVVDGTRDSIELQATGVAATTIYWVAEIKCVQAL